MTDADEETATVTVSSADAEDLAGNTEDTSINDTFAIDTFDPTVNLTGPVNADEVNAARAITFTMSETGSVQCSVDDTNWFACTTAVTTLGDITQFGPLGEGSIEWAKVRSELAKINYTGWATAEVRGGDRDRLAEIAAQMDRVLDL